MTKVRKTKQGGGRAGLGRVGRGWAGLGRVGRGWAGLGGVGRGWAGLGRVGQGGLGYQQKKCTYIKSLPCTVPVVSAIYNEHEHF
jgi:hypothetical protein